MEGEQTRRFDAWLLDYERASRNFATCRYLETIGRGTPGGEAKQLVQLHDQATRCGERLPLA
jgi:hypothetical protein